MNPRIRRVAPRFPIGRVYELEILDNDAIKRITTWSPLSVLEPLLGVGDAWSLIDAANRAWDGEQGGWVSLFD